MGILLGAVGGSNTFANSAAAKTAALVLGGESNRIVIVTASSLEGTLGTPTFNGVNMTAVSGSPRTNGVIRAYMWYMLEAQLPGPGTYDVSLTPGGTGRQGGLGVHYIHGAKQQAPEAIGGGTGSGASSWANSITTLTDGAWIVDVVGSSDRSYTPGLGQTERFDVIDGGDASFVCSTKILATAGVTTMGQTPSSATNYSQHIAAFAEEVVGGGVTVTPTAATVKVVSVNPSVVLGSINITPAVAAARAVIVDPNVLLSSIIITPAFAYVRAVTVGPIVIGGGSINPLGEGDSPGFLAFLVASAMYNELTAAGLGAGLNEPDENNSSEWETFLFG